MSTIICGRLRADIRVNLALSLALPDGNGRDREKELEAGGALTIGKQAFEKVTLF